MLPMTATDRGKTVGRAMSFASDLLNRVAPIAAIARRHDTVKLYVLVFLHSCGLAIMAITEVDLVAKAAFLLAWGILNFTGLALTRRPIVAAIIALEFIVGLVLLSQFKHDKLWMTVDFVDLMIIDQDTSSFLLTAIPSLRLPIFAGLFGTAFLLTAAWRFDPFRLRLRIALVGGLFCLGTLVFLSLSFPTYLYEDFFSQNYVSKFARSGVEAVHEFISHGYLESDSNVVEKLKASPPTACNAPRKLPHIILLHDESSFDITIAPGMKVPPGYHLHFESFDRKMRKLVVEGASGPSWFTEYNVLTGLSARSYGRFATSVTRIAGGRVVRGLPRSLTRCGYKSFSLYPFYGAFLGSRGFQTTAGIERYLDMQDLGTRGFEADSFYFDQATKIIAREGESRPLFLYIYNVANHFPWDTRLRPELTPNWHDLGNAPNIDEYIRSQEMTAVDYRVLLGRLAREFPNESFLVVRYGDHQPEFARHLIDPSLSGEELARHLEASDLRYFTTYYAIDTVNFTPADLSSALDRLDAPYLPLIVQEAAGVPLGPTFSEQKRILQRCHGAFYNCAGGTEVRRFNRLLIEAGLIRGL
jgi:sulfatase-like protein